MEKEPLVSVGIPCYNRPEGLRRTLECITGQTYRNLEIIISDNCSTNPEVERVVRDFASRDIRIQYYRQGVNKGPIPNFQFVLEKATGEYFMWAADDDKWENYFIEKCLCKFLNDEKKYVAVTMEAQYYSEEGQFEFFEEGKPFYEFYSEDIKERLEYILKYNYGNLFYSLFEKDALYEKNCCPFNIGGNIKHFNEIFLFLIVMKHGNWRVIPQVGLFKKTNTRTYEQAKWEKRGGMLPNSSGFSFYRRIPNTMKYHWTVLKEIETTIDFVEVDYNNHLKKLARKSISKHFYSILMRHKSPLF